MAAQAQVQKRYDSLYGDVKQFFTDNTSGKLSPASVTTLVRYSMDLVQTGQLWQGMRGSEKKDLVLGVISALVEDLVNDPQVVGENFDETSKQAILTAVAMAPMLIDAAVDFAKTYSASQPVAENGAAPRRPLFCCC